MVTVHEFILPRQIVSLHSAISVLFPKLMQSSPQRVLERLPSPHVTENGDQSLH